MGRNYYLPGSHIMSHDTDRQVQEIHSPNPEKIHSSGIISQAVGPLVLLITCRAINSHQKQRISKEYNEIININLRLDMWDTGGATEDERWQCLSLAYLVFMTTAARQCHDFRVVGQVAVAQELCVTSKRVDWWIRILLDWQKERNFIGMVPVIWNWFRLQSLAT